MRSLSQCVQRMFRVFLKITLRHSWVGFDLSSKITPDVSAIFQEQSIGFVFGMALEKDHHAAALLDEGVHAVICGSCQNAITTSRKSIFRYIVPPGVRHPEKRGRARRQLVVRDS